MRKITYLLLQIFTCVILVLPAQEVRAFPIAASRTAGVCQHNNIYPFTETDPGSQTVKESACKFVFTGFTRNQSTYTYFDDGASYWSSNHLYSDFTFTFTSASASGAQFFGGGWGNQAGNFATVVDGLYLYIQSVSSTTIGIYFREANAGGGSGSTTLVDPTGVGTYYLRLSLNRTASTYGTATLAYYTDATRTTEIGHVDRVLSTSVLNYRYRLLAFSNNSGSALNITGVFSNWKAYQN